MLCGLWTKHNSYRYGKYFQIRFAFESIVLAAPAAAEAAVDRPPGANSGTVEGRRAARQHQVHLLQQLYDICTAANTATAGLSGDAVVATVAAATNTTARTMADSAAAAVDVAEGVGSAADTKLV